MTKERQLIVAIQDLVDKDRIEDAWAMCSRLLEISPEGDFAYNAMGLMADRIGNLDDAKTLLSKAISINPENSEYHKNLGNVYKRMRRFDRAESCFQRAMSRKPDDAVLYYEFGVLCQSFDYPERAERYYRTSLQLNPANAKAYNNRGLIALRQHNHQKASALFRKAITLKPDFVAALINMGSLCKKMAEYGRALSYFSRALDVSPKQAETHRLVGDTHQTLGNIRQAIQHYEEYTRHKPKDAAGWINLGTAYQDDNNPTKAFECYQVALNLDNTMPQLHFNLGVMYKNQRRYEKAIAFFSRALDLNPQYEQAVAQMVYLLITTCLWQELCRYSFLLDDKTIQRLKKNEKPAETPFLNIIRHQDPSLNYEVARTWSRELVKNADVKVYDHEVPCNNRHGGKIRVGYLSANFRNHPTADLILGLIRFHDRSRFEIYSYSYGDDDGSGKRQAIADASDRFIDIFGSNDVEAAKTINDDQVDILVDLMGHTKDARMKICAAHPAPVQVRYLGFPGSSGAAFFEYILADEVVIPPKDVQYYSECPIFLPHSYQVNDYRGKTLKARLHRNLPGHERPFVFCSFATAYKIDRAVYSAWMRILKQSPNSVLWLMPENHSIRKNLLAAARASGVDPKRIEFKEKIDHDQHLLRLGEADIALDTVAVNGAATTSDALWAGLPVLTVRGNHFASRMSASLLHAIGLPDLVFDSLREYERYAVELSKNMCKLKKIRQRLANNIDKKPLFVTQLVVKQIETAYRLMWEKFLNGEKPSSMNIE